MPSKKISELTEHLSPASADLLAIVNGGVTKKISLGNLNNISPTDLKISTASKGGVFNGGFELGAGDVTQTSNGWIEDEKYGWYAYQGVGTTSSEFDSAVAYRGGKSLKLSCTNASGYVRAELTPVNVTLSGLAKYAIRLKPSTEYRFSAMVKTNNCANNAVYARFIQFDNAAVAGTDSNTLATKTFNGTNDWSSLVYEFTSDADAEFLDIFLHNYVAGNVSDAWFDDIKLEEVVPDTSFTGKVAEKIRGNLEAVTSTDNIDQSLDPTGAYANTYALTNAVNEGATHIQTFTPTKKYTTRIGVWVVAKGTGNWTLVVHDASNNVLASQTIANASLVDGAFNYFDVPNIWASGALHFHLYSSVADGTCKANTSNDLETASYIQRYAKKSEIFTLIANGIKTELKSDKDGVLSGSLFDLDNAKYRWVGINFSALANLLSFSGNVYSASHGVATTGNVMINGWGTANSDVTLTSGSSNADQYIINKVNCLVPIKRLRFVVQCRGDASGYADFQISIDGVNWTTLQNFSTAGIDAKVSIEVNGKDLPNGSSVFYTRFYKPAAQAVELRIYYFTIEADLDTSAIPQGLVYPLSTNQFAETKKLTSVATRIYYRLNKFANENGVIIPALEFTDASGVYIDKISLPLDNSQETNPAVAIVKASTTNGQAVGTGSDEGANYILNDGEYMTLSTAVDELSVVYLVGKGTTAFTNITKNTFYLSSNGDSNDSTQDPSHQGNFIIGVRQQGLVGRVGDIGEEIEGMKKNNYPAFGGIYEDDGSSAITITVGSTYYGWVSAVQGSLMNMGVDLANATADQLQIKVPGYYKIGFYMSAACLKAELVHASVFKNGVKLKNACGQVSVPANGSSVMVSGSGLVYLNFGDYVDLRVTTITGGETITVNHANLNLVKI